MSAIMEKMRGRRRITCGAAKARASTSSPMAILKAAELAVQQVA
jgi:hypothetical protein